MGQLNSEEIMSEGTMTRKKRTNRKQARPQSPPEQVATEEVEPKPDPPKERKPRVTSFVPAPCSSCTSLREDGSNYSRVYSTHRGSGAVVRYCKCDFCGNTFKQITTA